METPSPPPGDRIAKVLARAGVASRRDAERMIAEGRVSVNGKVIGSPALNVTPGDTVAVDGTPIEAAEPARLWLYHKPVGLVTSARDEKGRPTVFAALPDDMPRVMSVGRLDIASEGLLLLTNDGAIKRRLELPSTGWLRKYRVRVNGTPREADLDRLRQGVTVVGERFQGMEITLDRQQGANAWLTVGLREGKNREIRRALDSVGLTVGRLIRVSYGPFRLNDLAPGAVEEIKGRVLRDQLGLDGAPRLKPQRTRAAAGPGGAGDGPRAKGQPRPPGGPTPGKKPGPGRKGGTTSAARTGPPANPGRGPKAGPGREPGAQGAPGGAKPARPPRPKPRSGPGTGKKSGS